MLRAVVENFLDSLSEREFDAPLLAVLSAQGFADLHFIHGGFEFGKDVIAKRRDEHTGQLRQYSIQSKAGDLSQSDWRAVRPQLEECEYNTRAHPSFDSDLPRVAVLVTTGRLKGAAKVDAQEFRQGCRNRGLADFEVWDRETLASWLSQDPSLGLVGEGVSNALVALVSSVRSGTVSEPMLERHSREWLKETDDRRALSRSCLEVSIVCAALREHRRLDLAALMALHLHRAAWRPSGGRDQGRSRESESAVRLFASYAEELLAQSEPLLTDPHDLLRPLMDIAALATYPVTCCRMLELFGLLAFVTRDSDVRQRATRAIGRLCSDHPGASRPPSDQFAVSLIPAVTVLARTDRVAATQYLRRVSTWLLDRHDPARNGLGLASLDEDESTVIERLVAGALTSTQLDVRQSSYLATVLLDMLILLDEEQLYEALRDNLQALRVTPTSTMADETRARWRRGGPGVWPQPRVDYLPWGQPPPDHHGGQTSTPAVDALLLSAVARSRHDPAVIGYLLAPAAEE